MEMAMELIETRQRFDRNWEVDRKGMKLWTYGAQAAELKEMELQV